MTPLGGLAARISLWNRSRKMRLFLEHLRPTADTRVVDVGVGDTGFLTEPGIAATQNFFEALYPWPEQITAVGNVPLRHFAQAFPLVRCVVADGKDLPFEDDSFDIAFSNAVLEHVGSRDDQRQFVHELCRVARRVFVSTPNRWFPLELHTSVPVLHWLPRQLSDGAFAGLGKDIWRSTELLTRRELIRLFPETVEAAVVDARITLTAVAVRTPR